MSWYPFSRNGPPPSLAVARRSTFERACMVSDQHTGWSALPGGGRNREMGATGRWALPGDGAEPGAGVGAWATQVAPGFLADGADARVQPEPASLRRP